MTKKKLFNPPNPVFVLYDVPNKHGLCVYTTREELDENLKDYPMQDDETIVEYYLPTTKSLKSKEL